MSKVFPPSSSSTDATGAPQGLAKFPSLQGRDVFVTGGGSGIGAAIVAAFAEQGARVAFVDVARNASEALAQHIADAGLPRPWWRVCDVRDVNALQACVAEAAAELGSDFAGLVNNVASDAVVPGMRRLGAGSVINLGSTGWQGKGTGYPCYAIAKSSVNGLTRGLAKTLGQDRIRINTVSPGWVMTERQIKLWLDAEGEKELARNQCLPDKLRPHDIARMVLFLASDDAAMCTAQEFKVDAGWV